MKPYFMTFSKLLIRDYNCEYFFLYCWSNFEKFDFIITALQASYFGKEVYLL
jgi:hypothetical protein